VKHLVSLILQLRVGIALRSGSHATASLQTVAQVLERDIIKVVRLMKAQDSHSNFLTIWLNRACSSKRSGISSSCWTGRVSGPDQLFARLRLLVLVHAPEHDDLISFDHKKREYGKRRNTARRISPSIC
jgi:hypothetical protein